MKIYICNVGEQGNEWKFFKTDFNADVGDYFMLVFIAIKGDGSKGDIALDDILVSEGRCNLRKCHSGYTGNDISVNVSWI